MQYDALELFKDVFFKNAAMFKKTFIDVESEFGLAWREELDQHLGNLFGSDEAAYLDAVRGYSKFSIDAMRLQIRFNKTKKYDDQSYAAACEKVYMNDTYMKQVYLPGIFVSQFLWRHHYRQFLYHKKSFLPLLDPIEDKRFYEVGTGTGFYTLQVYRHDSTFRGVGIDISPSSRYFTMKNVVGWGFEDRFTTSDANIIGADFEPFPCVQCIEVLEHLSDPQTFLNHLRKMLRPGGYGFVAAALTAPETDHIYLYWTADDVIKQLVAAGFEVRDYAVEAGYEGEGDEIIPKVAAFIIS